PLNEVRWLSRHFAVNALIRNYDVLVDYCIMEVNENNYPVAKYCLKKLTDPQYRIALTVLDDIWGELSELCQTFQRSCLTIIEAYRYAKAKIAKFCSQYLVEKVHWSEKVKQQMASFDNTVNTRGVLHFVSELCEHLDCQFPENELQEWSAFILKHCFLYGTENVIKLVGKYQAVLNLPTDGSITERICKQYTDYKFIIVEKMKAGAIKTFADIVTYTLKEEQFTDLAQFVDICAMFQTSSAECECGFSLMNQIKNKSRNRLEVNHMDQLIRIKYYLAANGDVNLDKIYHHWTTDKYRREK
uniref:HAT C-terminal dimerisation domain-containing protein n=1 Tax=Latimeria chalumnae TaxID=7897 RepID=H2ZUA4_LATCH